MIKTKEKSIDLWNSYVEFMATIKETNKAKVKNEKVIETIEENFYTYNAFKDQQIKEQKQKVSQYLPALHKDFTEVVTDKWLARGFTYQQILSWIKLLLFKQTLKITE